MTCCARTPSSKPPQLVPGPGRRAATGRLLDYYLHTATAADRLLYPQRRPIALAGPRSGVTSDDLASHAEALAWLDAEHRGLLAAVSLAAENAFDVHAWQVLLQRARAYPGSARAVITPGHDQNLRAFEPSARCGSLRPARVSRVRPV